MKKVEMFEAEDGTLFKTIAKALKYNKIYKRVKDLCNMLGGPINDPGCNFANGDGYYQLTPEMVRRFDNAFIEAIKEFEPELFKEYSDKNLPFVITNYFTGRWLDDNNSPLYTAVMLRHRVDEKFRLWGQTYYAMNPEKGKQNKLGDFK